MGKRVHVLDSLHEDIPSEDFNTEWEFYRERVHQLLKQGLKGFIGGCLYVLIGMGLASGFAEEPGMLANPMLIPMTIFGGIGCIGFPYGWEKINKFIGGWSIWGSVFVVAMFFVIKAALALMIGFWGYPIALIYNLFKSQKSKKNIRRAWLIVAAIVIACYLLVSIAIAIEAKKTSSDRSSSNSTNITHNASAETTEAPRSVTAATFSENSSLVTYLCEDALNSTSEQENTCINSGWIITESSQVLGTYFFESNNPNSPHRDYLHSINVSNAIVVVTAFYIKQATVPINNWDVWAWVYPNYSFDENGTLVYDANNAYHISTRLKDLEDTMGWLRGEYDDMVITELTGPNA